MNLLFSVDWERGRWPGIERTPEFCALLDEFAVPCTWFVEMHDHPPSNMCKRFPSLVRGLAERSNDSLGLHIHWGRYEGGKVLYPTDDLAWVKKMVRENTAELRDFTGRRICSFRGGAFLHVPRLLEMLAECNYESDSTVAALQNPLECLLQRPLTGLRPYVGDKGDNRRQGDSGVLVFPVSLYLFARRFRFVEYPLFCLYLRRLSRLASQTGDVWFSFFIHSYDLESARRRNVIRACLNRASKTPGTEFLNIEQAAARLRQVSGFNSCLSTERGDRAHAFSNSRS